jgi:4-oxalocrotonate tautomerase
MPVITVAARALSLEKKRELVDKVTALICETYGVPPSSVTVFIEEHSPENIGVAGVLIADRK